MSDLVQGVKLKFELPFTLPVPVSFPFESIGDFRPITRIPKYDYALEKRIMKDIKRQKQEDQFSMLRQAQQQLSMVDLIASRKTRHKGKEPERKSMAVVPSIGAGSLLKPSSEGGVGRQQGDTALSGPYMSGIQDAYLAPRPANAPFGVGVRPGAGVQPQATAAPPSLGLGFGYPGVVRPSPGQQRPQPQPPAIQHQLRPQQTALPHQQPQPSLRADQHPAAHNPRFSTSFGMGSGAPGAAQMLQAAAAMRPALPPKPDEWKPQPFEAFSEFDYATGAPGSMGSSDSAGHVEQLNLLLGMGFSQPQAIHALEMYDYDVNQASNYLIDKAS
ncbi:hypothetical protein LPJ61_001166 [Coemansia biformis]|uniref:UBA domain-containing protein n=1 Tax=Coemansia biformis TaxID=1286918 RepID=A0A9W7YAH5_9FUNG|nr:hypothetical protein LPJ61_001166 [Coemansia biformis]